MATWSQVESAIKLLSAEQLNNTMWSTELHIDGTDRTQRVFVAYELVPPDMEFVKVSSPIDSAGAIMDPGSVLQQFGSLTVGSLSYLQFSQGGGMLFIGTSIPLWVLDLSNPHPFLLYMHVLAQAADMVKAKT